MNRRKNEKECDVEAMQVEMSKAFRWFRVVILVLACCAVVAVGFALSA